MRAPVPAPRTAEERMLLLGAQIFWSFIEFTHSDRDGVKFRNSGKKKKEKEKTVQKKNTLQEHTTFTFTRLYQKNQGQEK